jgi:hypothetical protein
MNHKTLSDYGITSKICMMVLLWLIYEMVMWSIACEREGMEVAAIMGATLIPIVGLFKFVMEWSDRKNQSHT